MALSRTTHHPECVAATWLAERLAVDPARIEAMRRAGELIAVREARATEWLYPAWQFERWAPRPGVPRVVAAARATGMADERLYEILVAPLGMTRGHAERRLADLLVEGRIDDVVGAIRSSS
jgi:hypothetical protein